MNYADLKLWLDSLPEDRLLDDVTLCVNGEYCAAGVVTAEYGDVLDIGHPFFVPLVEYTLITYDVLGNSKEGWEINNKHKAWEAIKLPPEGYLSSEVISRYFLYPCVLSEDSCCDDNVIYVVSPKGKPLFELIALEDED